MTTTLEIHYHQDPYDPAFDYSQAYYSWPNDISPSDSWIFTPSPSFGHFWQAFRIADGHIQQLALEVHAPGSDFRLHSDVPEVQLFKDLMHIRPLRTTETELRVQVGRSHEREGRYYVRLPYPETSLLHFHNLHEMVDDLFPAEIGIEYPGDWDAGYGTEAEWWLSYFDQVTQSEFQQALSRLMTVREWLYELSRRFYSVSKRYLKERLKEVNQRGWPQEPPT